jgi:predicted DNA-binding transcriptional regulator YafY
MTRTQRLLELLQILRAHRYPVTALTLSANLKISVHRLQGYKNAPAPGVCIEGVPGLDIINSDYHLPPLVFTAQELNALTLGLNWVCHNTDADFKKNAKKAIAKIRAVIPDRLQEHIEYQSYLTGPTERECYGFGDIHHAINERKKSL